MNEPHDLLQFGWCNVEGKRIYFPSPQEIREQCQAIQATWPPDEFRSRAPWAYPNKYVARAIDRRDLAAAIG